MATALGDVALLEQYKAWARLLIDHPGLDVIPELGIKRGFVLRALKTIAIDLSLPSVVIEDAQEKVFLQNNLIPALDRAIAENKGPAVATLEDLVKEWQEAKTRAQASGSNVSEDKTFQERQTRINRSLENAFRRKQALHIAEEITDVTADLKNNLFITIEKGREAVAKSIYEDPQLRGIIIAALPKNLSAQDQASALFLIASRVSTNVVENFSELTETGTTGIEKTLASTVHKQILEVVEEHTGRKPFTEANVPLTESVDKIASEQGNRVLAAAVASHNIDRIYQYTGVAHLASVLKTYLGDTESGELGSLGGQIRALLTREASALDPARQALAQQFIFSIQRAMEKELSDNPRLGIETQEASKLVGDVYRLTYPRFSHLIEPHQVKRIGESFVSQHGQTVLQLARLTHLMRLRNRYTKRPIVTANEKIYTFEVGRLSNAPFPWVQLASPQNLTVGNIMRALPTLAAGGALATASLMNEELREGQLLMLLGFDSETIQRLDREYNQIVQQFSGKALSYEQMDALQKAKGGLLFIRKIHDFAYNHPTLQKALRNIWQLPTLQKLQALNPKLTLSQLTKTLIETSAPRQSEQDIEDRLAEAAVEEEKTSSQEVPEPLREKRPHREPSHWQPRTAKKERRSSTTPSRGLVNRLLGTDVEFERGKARLISSVRKRLRNFFVANVRDKVAGIWNRFVARVGIRKFGARGLGFLRLRGGGIAKVGTRALFSFGRTFTSFFGIPSRLGIGGILSGAFGGLANLARGFLFGLRGGLFFGGRLAVSLVAPLFANPVTGTVIIAIILIVLLTLLITLGAGFPSGPGVPGTVGGNIAQCTFYRGGDSIQGLRIGNPQMAALITDVSTRVGVPPAIIAGIMRVETASALASTDPSYLSNDYDAHTSGVAYGVMQFTIPTFTSTFDANRAEMASLFNKTDVRIILDPQSNMAPPNILRIYSVRDSIIAAAFKVRNDKRSINGDGPWDEATVKTIAARYYGTNADGTTNYPGYEGSVQNYGSDLWRSYINCISTTAPPSGGILASCPLQDPYIITNGTKDNPIPGRGGHCDPNYTRLYPFWCPPQRVPGVSNAIDVAARDQRLLLPVYLPSIEGNVVRWNYENGNYTDSSVAGIGYGHDFTAVVNGHAYFLHFFHLDQNLGLARGQGYNSGTLVANMYNMGGPHVHFTISRDGSEMQPHIPPPGGMGMCSNP